jgi:hypothetical protein
MVSHLPLLTVDKGYAQAVKSSKWDDLIKSFLLVIPTAFLAEVFDTTPKSREFTLTKFPEFHRVDLPTFLRKERESGEPVTSVDASELPVWNFNAKIVPAGWEPNDEEAAVISEHKEKNVAPLLDCWEELVKEGGVPGFSDAEMKFATGSADQFIGLCKELAIADRVRHVAEQIGIPHAAKMGPEWFYFRTVQVWALQGMVLARRFKNPADKPSRRRLEHDLQDFDYLTLGLITGNLATADYSPTLSLASMAWRFKLLQPQGNLLLPTTGISAGAD